MKVPLNQCSLWNSKESEIESESLKKWEMWILHGWSWCRLGWLPVKEQLRNGAVGLTLRYLGHAGTVSHMFLAQPTHSTTATFPWSAIHGPNYIFHHRIFCRAFSKMDSSKMFAFSCALSPCVCSVHATQSKGLRAKGLRAKRCLPLRRSGNITCDRSLVFISSFHQNVENV